MAIYGFPIPRRSLVEVVRLPISQKLKEIQWLVQKARRYVIQRIN